MSTETARNAFEVRRDDRDYSGLSIANRHLEDADIERSFFNGANLANCVFVRVKMNNTEYSEAKVQTTEFSDVDLSGSDFVDSLFEDSYFLNCTFAKGEWRDWPAPGSVDTELGVFMEPEVSHGEAEVYTRVQA